ncbi:hypothetical protein ScPMuIL_002819 [Solemya velum]
MVVRCVLLLSLVCMSISFLMGSNAETDHVLLAKKATSKVIERFEETATRTHTRSTMKPKDVAAFMISMSDSSGDGQLDSTELISFYTDMANMDTETSELIASAFLMSGDRNHDDKLSRRELTKLIRQYGSF